MEHTKRAQVYITPEKGLEKQRETKELQQVQERPLKKHQFFQIINGKPRLY